MKNGENGEMGKWGNGEMGNVKKYEILLVDDDPLVLESIGVVLENKGYEVVTVENGGTALEILAKEHFDLVLSDLVMDEVDAK